MEQKAIRKKAKNLLKLIFGGSSKSNEYIEPIDKEEILARYIFQKKGRYNSSGDVRPGAFMPNQGLETSVFRKTKMSGKDYLESKRKVAVERKLPLRATALLAVRSISADLNVRVEPEESKHKWHANILGWPAEKHAQKDIAIQLAKNSQLNIEQP